MKATHKLGVWSPSAREEERNRDYGIPVAHKLDILLEKQVSLRIISQKNKLKKRLRRTY